MKRKKPSKHPYNKVILGISVLFAIIGGIAGILFLFLLAKGEGPDTIRVKALFAPLSLAFGGYLLGTGVGVVFAPTSFLKSRDGEKWLKRVGTSNPTMARIVSAVVLFCVAGGIGLLAYFIFR